jgi:uncharacterized membrane protein
MHVAAVPKSVRLASIDILRGLACVVMAIDHVRVYSGLPAGGPTAGIFLTRWVTHFVAPAFCFFAGTAAYFLGRRLADTGTLRRFLVSRGLLLVLLEMTVIRLLWSGTIGPDFLLAGVIWMLGWCMVLLALFVGMRPDRVGWVGVAIIVLQPLFGLLATLLPASATPWWAFIYPSGSDAAFGINVLYVIVPWIGVMMAGYGFGPLLEREPVARDRLMYRLGLGLTAAFLVFAACYTYLAGPPAEGDGPRMGFWMRMLDQRKYPASLAFLMMTLGPMIALVPWAERAKGWGVDALRMFGSVPMWFYLLHLAVIHAAAIAVTLWITGQTPFEWYSTAPFTWLPEEARWTLPMLYAVWAVCILILFPLCRWYAWRKAVRPWRWQAYI